MSEAARDPIEVSDFFKADLRVGVIHKAEPFPEARKPAYKLEIDFGDPIGTKKSSAQITDLYQLEELAGRQIVAVVNFPPRQIGPVRSEVLVLGSVDGQGRVVLLDPGAGAHVGAQIC